jgi:hypothetical protein
LRKYFHIIQVITPLTVEATGNGSLGQDNSLLA